MPARLVLPTAALAFAFVLAGCGGSSSSSSSSNSSSSSSSTNPSSSKYDPATAALHKAGLESCSETQKSFSQSITTTPGLTGTRSFYVAKDCNGKKVTPNQVTVFAFASRDALNSGLAAIKKAYPNGATVTSGALVVLATGPQAQENIAAISKVIGASG